VKTICLTLARPKTSSKLLQLCRPCSQQAGKGKDVKRNSASSRHYSTTAAAEPFLNGSSSVYVEEMYSSWLKDPTSVHKVFIVLMFVKSFSFPSLASI